MYHGEDAKDDNHDKAHRDAVQGDHHTLKNIEDYVKKVVPKDDNVKKILLQAVQSNVLFANCSRDEIVDIVDAFE